MLDTNKFTQLFTLLMLLFLTSCEKESIDLMSSPKKYPNVDSELWVYFHRFEEAALNRGIIIDLTDADITGSIEELHIDNVIGVCNYNVNADKQITLDKNFWNRAAFMKKELAVFHELGHCYLKLAHRDDAYPDGLCKSIMRSGYSGCLDKYDEKNREEYLDEFFQ